MDRKLFRVREALGKAVAGSRGFLMRGEMPRCAVSL